jgi:hypothetical protein
MNSVSLKVRSKLRLLLLPAIMMLVFIFPRSVRAGFCRTDPGPTDYRHEFQFFAGYSPESSTLIGTTTDRQFVAAGFNYSYRCWPWRHVSISFTPGLIPAAILIQPTQTFLVTTSTNSSTDETVPSHAVYGFGVTPLGFTFDFGSNHQLYPFIETNEGIIASTEPIPLNITNATGLNFLIDLGGGIKWNPSGKPYAITLAYKFLHISNGFTTSVNPGVDDNLFYLGFSFLRR